MAPELRQRKPAQDRVAATKPEDYDYGDDKKNKKRFSTDDGPDLDPNPFIVFGFCVIFAIFMGFVFYYKIDNRTNGPFAQYVNKNYPIIDRTLNNYGAKPMFGAAAAETTGLLKLTEEELKAFTGEDAEKPIYLGINGTIFDVSASPAFYGPGGHYNHFVGKDATRAWITECWDEPEQFTWRLDDVEVMFMPKYLDEMLEDVADGNFEGDLGAVGAMPQEMLQEMAKKSIARFGKVSKKEKAKRRVSDKKEAEEKAQEVLAHWFGFFSKSEKYQIVGEVVRREDLPEPPKPCAKAMEKRPMKGGKLESMMGAMGGVMGATMGKGGPAQGQDKGKAGEMPAAVKEQIEKAKQKAKEATGADKTEEQEPEPVKVTEDEEDLAHEEL